MDVLSLINGSDNNRVALDNNDLSAGTNFTGTANCDGVMPVAVAACIARRTDIWLFGYGSLMWNPGFPYRAAEPALLKGYHRRFCVYSHRYRGTPEQPGLVLGLDRGGSCRGIAFRIA